MSALKYASRRCLRDFAAKRTLFTKSRALPSSPLSTGIYASVFVISAGLFTVYYYDARSSIHRYVLTPLVRAVLDAETSHRLAVKALAFGLAARDPCSDDERLGMELWGQKMSNPVGVAAGFDKDGEAIDGLFNLGFSWVEIGSVTPKSQPGNPRPRFFRLPEDDAVINRYGFPSQGHAAVLSRLRSRIPKFSTGESDNAAFRDGSILAVNLGKNKNSPVDSIEDFVAGVRAFGPYSDVLVINVSSPNTPGLRGLQNKDSLITLLAGVTKARDELAQSPKLLLKLSPDLDEPQLVEIAEVIRNSSIDGVIVSNTTIQRPASLQDAQKNESGGLSGPPLKPYSLAALRVLRANLPSNIPLIGCGGISSGADALEYVKSGASLVQIYTSFGYDGVGTCRRIKDEIVEILKAEQTTWRDIVEKSVNVLSPKQFPIKQSGDLGVTQLISEARELGKMLDKLDEKMSVR